MSTVNRRSFNEITLWFCKYLPVHVVVLTKKHHNVVVPTYDYYVLAMMLNVITSTERIIISYAEIIKIKK